MKPERKYADVFKPLLSEHETTELWQQVQGSTTTAHRATAAPRRGLMLALGVAAVVASAAGFLLLHRSEPAFVVGKTMEAPAQAAQELELPDGSKVELEAGARVRIERFVPEATRLVLTRGAALFDVQHRSSRSFVVGAGSVDVAVIGTRFRVSLSNDTAAARVDVAVERGVVEVRRPSGAPPVSLAAGERWTSASGVAVAAAPEPPGDVSTTPSSTPPAPPVSAAPAPRAVGSAEGARAATASSVFEAANQARVAGRARDAAGLFDQVRRGFRGDPRAALAALQLGRIRLDELGDAPGAIEALNDALALGGGGSLRDDAQARLIEAYERSGNVTACRKAKQAYLTGQPHGAHRAAVEQRCP